MRTNTRAHLFLVLAGLIFGVNYWVAKGLMPGFITPMQLIFFRVTGALLLFTFFDFFVPHKAKKIAGKDMLRIAVAALFGVGLNQILFFEGLNLTTPVDASLIHVLNPIMVLVLAALFIGEKFTWRKGIGVVLGAAGAAFLILYGKDLSSGSGTFKGNLLILGNAAAYAAYLVIIKPLMEHYHPVRVMKWIFLFGLVWVMPLSLGPALQTDFSTFTGFAWFSVIYVIAGTTFIAYLLTISALKHLNASVVSFYIYLQPLIAALIAIFVGKELLQWPKLPAALAIFAGVYLISTRRRKPQVQSLPNL